MGSLAQSERAALADLLEEVGPDAPTLCGEWTARDLAAHLVVRERTLLPAAGIALPLLSGRTEGVQRSYAARPYDELVALVRSGPPRLSVFGLPGVDAAANAIEYFVHHEDVRRARDGWEPRDLPVRAQKELWGRLRVAARGLMRHSPCRVVLRIPAGSEVTVGRGAGQVEVTGDAGELTLFAYGRQGHARVEIAGDESLVAQVTGASFGV